MIARVPWAAVTAGAIVLAIAAVAAAAWLGGSDAPPGSPEERLEAQALAIERQLLCPQCTSKRLDVCELPICKDMQNLIRQRLQAGDTPDEIVFYFSNRYGQRVLAEIPRRGFNLVLFGWVGGSILLVALLGGGYLLRLSGKRDDPDGDAGGDDDPHADDAWLEAQLQERPR